MDDDVTQQTILCVRCGRALRPDAAEGLCPVCLLSAGAASVDDSELPTLSTVHPPSPPDETSTRLREGDIWGNYRIGRRLGRGGMGEVFEAEQLSTGRRLALKVLRSRLQGPQDRAQFLREGQLAASVSHPHTVYIFGSEEIEGIPVISMELLTGRTLKDRVADEGPLAPAGAADAALDIIGGLDAASAAGILHRDVKPSNCFLNHDGSVKVGDFGLSISTMRRDVRLELASSGFQGTPQFAAPEQLRGEPLDLRADIYAVGATLYYLLTGRPPFEDAHLADLVARTLHEPPPSPRATRRAVPPGLALLVVQCLSKSPAARPQSYAALAEALRPYASANNVAPRPGTRILAGIVDSLTVLVPIGAIVIWLQSHSGVIGLAALPPLESRVAASLWLIMAAYYLTFERLSGAALGKRLFALRVVSAIGPPSWRQLLIRTSIFFLPGMVGMAVVLWRGSLPAIMFGTANRPDIYIFTPQVVALLFTAILFASARPGNGWSGLHDLASGTRVVAPMRLARRSSRAAHAAAVPPLDSGVRYGPFVVIADLGATDRGTLILAFDPVLRRDVWIHRVPLSDPPTSRARQDVSRVGRLHWLGGQRTTDHQWDAFEAPSGRALLAAHEPVRWTTLKVWLMDMTDEFAAAERDGSPPSASLQHLWVRGDGHLVLLDFRYAAAGVVDSPDASLERTAPQLLAAVAAHARSLAPAWKHGPAAYPLSLLPLIDMWMRGRPRTLQELRAQLLKLSGAADRVTRARRALPLALSAVPIILATLAGMAVVPAMRQMRTAEHANMLQWLDLLLAPGQDPQRLDPALREDAERYVVERFRASLSDDVFWRTMAPQPRQSYRHDLARRLLAGYRPTQGKSLAELSVRLAPQIDRANAASRQIADGAQWFASLVFTTLSAIVVGLVMICHLISSLLVPGGVITRLGGLAVVTADDREVRRGRSLGRALLVWSPAIAWFAYLALTTRGPEGIPVPQSPLVPLALAYLLLAAGIIATLVTPWRGWHDRLAKTWVVPR